MDSHDDQYKYKQRPVMSSKLLISKLVFAIQSPATAVGGFDFEQLSGIAREVAVVTAKTTAVKI
jgi:hypothetical protein